MNKKSLKISFMSLAGIALASASIATSVVLTSCAQTTPNQPETPKPQASRNYVGFDAKVVRNNPQLFANNSSETESQTTSTTDVILDPSENQNAINEYIKLLTNIKKEDLQKEFSQNLIQFFEANEFEQENSQQEIEAEIRQIKVKDFEYHKPDQDYKFGHFSVIADVVYEVEVEDEITDQETKKLETQVKTFTLTPAFAGKNEVQTISQQLIEWKTIHHDSKYEDAMEDLAEIYFGDRNDKDFDLEDIFESLIGNKKQTRLMEASDAIVPPATNDQPVVDNQMTISQISSDLKLNTNNQVSISLSLTGTNLSKEIKDYQLKYQATKPVDINWTPSQTDTNHVVFQATVSLETAKLIANKELTVSAKKQPNVKQTITLSPIMVSFSPSISLKPNVDRTKFDTVTKENLDSFVTINYPSPLTAADMSVLSVMGDKFAGTISVIFQLNPCFMFENQSTIVKVTSDYQNLPDTGIVARDWEDSKGVLNYLNNFTNNVSPYAKMAGWKVVLKEAEYTPVKPAKTSRAMSANPLEDLWVPSTSISSIFYPSLNANNTTSNLTDISQALTDHDLDLAFDMQALSKISIDNWLKTVFSANTKKENSNYIWTDPTAIQTTLENLKAYGISLPSKQTVDQIMLDVSDFNALNHYELEVKLVTKQVVYELELQSSFFAKPTK